MRRAARQTAVSYSQPAPHLGMVDDSSAYSANDPRAAIYLYDLIADQESIRVRPGSVDFATGLRDDLGVAGEVRTILHYNSVVAGGVQDAVFAATSDGIYDITAGGDFIATAPVLAWPTSGGEAGWCSYVNWTSVAGDHYILLCDEANGYYTYDGTTWAVGTIASNPVGLGPGDLVHIVEWGGRLWFTERDTAKAWYLGVLDLSGTAEALDVGSRFKRGGHLVQCGTWTVDAGDNLNDKLVMLSAAGDVLVWDGDPDIADSFRMEGRWYVGSAVHGRRAMSDWGGDLAILSTAGITRMTTLLEAGIADASGQAVSRNIERTLRERLEGRLDIHGWSIEEHPTERLVVITTPNINATDTPLQFVISTHHKAWSMWRGRDMLCTRKTGLGYFYGTRDGRVVDLVGTVDDVPIGGVPDDSSKPVEFSLLTHYISPDKKPTWKRVVFCRPTWIGDADPTYGLAVRYDYDLAEVGSIPPFASIPSPEWDAAIWDTSRWPASAQAYSEIRGTNGMGRKIAIAVKGSTSQKLTLVGFDMTYDAGGVL